MTAPSHKQHTTNIRKEALKILDYYYYEAWMEQKSEHNPAVVDKIFSIFLTLLDELEMEKSGVPEVQFYFWGDNFETIKDIKRYNQLVDKFNTKISHIKLSLKGEQ